MRTTSRGPRLRYERSVTTEAHAPSRRLRYGLFAILLVAVGGSVGAVIATSSHDPAPSAPARAAIETAFLEANVLLENLGAPPPTGVRDGRWALTSIPVVRRNGRAVLARSEHRWIGPTGELVPLSTSQSALVRTSQAQLVAELFGGSLRASVLGELDGILAGERRTFAKLASPGGARVTSWLGISERGGRASAEAVVENWVQIDTVQGSAPNAQVASVVEMGLVDAKATLLRSGGRWRLTELSQSPWQQAT